MIATIVASPLAWLVAILVAVSATLPLLGRRALLMGPVGWAGAIMFLVSTICMNAWRWADGLESQVLVWQIGLLFDGLLYLTVVATLFRVRLSLFVFLTAAVLWFAFQALSAEDTQSRQIYEILQIIAIAALACLCFRLVPQGDLIGTLLWAVLAVGEVTAVFQTVDCQLLHGMFGTRAEGSACEQVYGWDLHLLPLFVIFLIWSYFLFRWFFPKAK